VGDPSQSTGQRAKRSLLQRVLMAQESGIALVILLMAIALTVFGGTKTDRTFKPLSESAVVTNAQGLSISIANDPHAGTYSTADGWSIVERAGKQQLVRTRQVSIFLNFNNIVQVLVFASFIAIMSVGITAVISTGGIDLSVGSTYALAALCGAIVLRYDWGQGPPSVPNAAIVILLALIGFGAIGARVGASKLTAKNPTRAVSSKLDSILKIALGLGVACLFIAGWLFLGAIRDGWDMSQRSTLPLIATLPLALGVCCLVGAAAGWLNGVMIVGLRVHPFIITLGTMAAYRGLVALPTKAQTVGDFPASYQGFVKLDVAGVNPVPVLFMVLVALAGVFVLARTVLGRYVYAIGGNETAARYAGIPVNRVKVIVYTIMGALAGLSASLYLGYFGAAETNAGNGYELKVIAAAVIGGASLSGGRGSALGAVLGALLVQLIDNAMIILSIDQNYNQIVMGGAIIAAVVMDQVKSRLVPAGR